MKEFKLCFDQAITYIKTNPIFVLTIYFYLLVVSFVNTFVSQSLTPGETTATFFAFLMELLTILAGVTLLRHIFLIGKKSDVGFFSVVWQGVCEAPLFVFYNIVVGLYFLFGLILIIIPGFYFLSQFYFAPYLCAVDDLIDQRDESGYMDRSKRLTANRLVLVLFFILLFNFLPMGLFAPLAWIEVVGYEQMIKFGVLPLETGMILFAELIFIYFFKGLLKTSPSQDLNQTASISS